MVKFAFGGERVFSSLDPVQLKETLYWDRKLGGFKFLNTK